MISSITDIPSTAICGTPRDVAPPARAGNYIMQGAMATRALDIYHLILAPTHACNLRCKHCYLPDHETNLLPRAVALRLVDEWSEMVLEERGAYGGIFHIKGGEPFVVPYLWEMVDRLSELKSLRLMFTTNGTFTKPEVFRRLNSCQEALDGNLTMVVSLDGASAATHELLRGKGQFAATLTFLQELKGLGIQMYLNCVLHDGNLHEIDAYINLARGLEVQQINFLPLVPKGYGKTLRCHQAPHLNIHQLLQAAYDKGDESTRNLLTGSLPDILRSEKEEITCAACECVAAYRGLFYIKPDGSIYTCPNLEASRFSIGNVHQDSLRAASDRLNALYAQLRKSQTNDRYICTGEREKYAADGDHQNTASLARLQSSLQVVGPDSQRSHAAKTAFCVSRNW